MTASTTAARDLHAAGYRAGPPPWLSPESECIDRAACAVGACAACRQVGLKYVPWYHPATRAYRAEEQDMTEHTRGPWVVHGPTAYCVSGPDGGFVGRADTTRPEWEANLRLMAAAPTMYEYIARKAQEGDPDAQKIVALVGQ